MQSTKVYEFGELRLDGATNELSRGGKPVSLTALCLRVLRCLVENQGRFVARDELLRVAWPDVVVNEGALRQAVWELRRALGLHAGGCDYVESARGKGYRLAVPVREHDTAHARDDGPCSLVGRVEPLRRLRTALDAAVRSEGRACLISGPPGVGKTRLARELTRLAEAEGVLVLSGYGDRDEGAPPLWAWTQMLRAPRTQTAEELHARCLRLAPAAFHILTEPALPIESRIASGASPAEQRFLLLHELTQLFVRCARELPLVLFVDDLQWSDEASLLLFSSLLEQISDSRVLLLATCRTPLERSSNASLVRKILRRVHDPLELSGLSVSEVHAVLERQAGRPVALDHAHELHTLSQGNPLFALELARVYAAHVPGSAACALPEGSELLVALLRRRFSWLSASCAEAVRAAAVLGEEFSVAELAGVLEVTPALALEALDEPLSQQLIAERSPLRFRFVHPMMRQAAYGELSARTRAELHARAGSFIEAQSGEVSLARSGQLSHHFVRAAALGFAVKAVEYTARAAHAAFDTTAFARAADLYEQALGCLELVPTASARETIELKLRWGEALRASGAAADRVNALFGELGEQAAALGLVDLLAAAALGYCGHHDSRFTPSQVAGVLDARGTALLESALARVDEWHVKERAGLLSARAFASLYTPREGCQADAAEAVALARTTDDATLLARVLFIQLVALSDPRCQGEQLAVCDELVELCQTHALFALEQQARLSRAICQLQRGERELAELDFARVKTLAKQLGSPEAQDRALQWPLFRALWEARLDDAERLTRRASELSGDTVRQRVYFLTRTTTIHAWRNGPSAEYFATFESVLCAFPDASGPRCARVTGLALAGARAEAIREFDELARDGFRLLPPAQRLGELCALVDGVDKLADVERATLLYRELEPYGDSVLFYGLQACPGGPVALSLGVLARTQGNFVRAEEWLHKARLLAQKLGASSYEQTANFERAKLALLRNLRGDRALATLLLREVQAFSRERGAHWLGRQAQDMLTSLREHAESASAHERARYTSQSKAGNS